MKAKVKTTGEVIEVSQTENIITKRGVERQYVDNKRSWCTYVQSELEFIKEEPCKTMHKEWNKICDRHSYNKMLFSFKPLKLEHWFTKEEIKRFNL